MRVFVLGAGAVGSVVGSVLAKRKEVEGLVVADRSAPAARALAEKLGRERAEAVTVDAADVRAMADAFKGSDIVINVVLPRFNFKIMDACLKARTSYIDAATDLALGKEKPGEIVKAPPESLQLAYDERFRKEGLTGMLSMGSDPGLTNLFARMGADRLDTVDEILVRDGDSGTVEGHEFASLWSTDTLIEEVLMPALAFHDGRFVRLGSLEGEEVFEFPAPVGPLTVYNVDHEETNTFPLFINKGMQRCDFKIALPKELAEALRVFEKFRLHEGRPVEVEVKATGERVKVAPRDVLTALMPNPKELAGRVRGTACIVTVVRGTKGGKKDGWMIWFTLDHQETFRKYGFNAVTYPVGAPLALAALMIGRGEIARRGVFPPEAMDPAPFLRRLPEFGIDVQERQLS